MTLQQQLASAKQAWSIVVSKRAEAAANDGVAYQLLDRVAEHLDDEVFELRTQLNIAAHMRAVFGE
jgi:hypothetical protein